MGKDNRSKKSIIIATIIVCVSLLCCAVFVFLLPQGININDGELILTEADVFVVPGEIFEKEFFIENSYNCKAYYRIYLHNEPNGLFDAMDILIKDGDTVVYQKPAYCAGDNCADMSIMPLKANERKTLTISFSIPGTSDNSIQNNSNEFKLFADISVWRGWFS